jgi:hypothetical protein
MNYITLKQFMEAIDHRVTEGAQYFWACYGDAAMSLDHWNGKHGPEGMSIHCVFDTESADVYEMQAWDYRNNREYRWIHPDYRNAHKEEAFDRAVDPNQSLDDRKFIDIEVAEDILEKARAIFRGEEYDTRIVVQLDLTEKEQLLLMRLAHENDMTVNDYVASILEAEIERTRNQTAA